ncbi:hypothetical protein WME95_15095 [Sorangium sp. So ce327]|jgi:hypothetical protein|uniref:hypothetical protein n=1 Tax=Sorangium sp. So ce327 TaxID=3133301 RepID=UPI003F62E529
MNRRRWIAAGAVAVVAALGLVVAGTRGDLGRAATALGIGDVSNEGAQAGEHPQAKERAAAPSRHARPRARLRPGSAAAGAADAPSEDASQRPKVDVEKVEAALERFNTISSRITQEQLDAEQKRMLEAKEKLSAIEAPEPSAREIVDDHGFQWVELTYPSGDVRYELPQARP